MKLLFALILWMPNARAADTLYPDEIEAARFSTAAHERLARFVTPDGKRLRRFGACQSLLVSVSEQRGHQLSDAEILRLLPFVQLNTGEALIDFPVRILPDGTRRTAEPDISGDEI